MHFAIVSYGLEAQIPSFLRPYPEQARSESIPFPTISYGLEAQILSIL